MKKLSAFVLSVLLLFSLVTPTFALDMTEFNGGFRIEDGVLTSYEGDGGHVVIPGEVTKIGKHAFWEDEAVISVVIPEGVTEIDEYAFEYCENLTNITIPSSLIKIGAYAFWECSKLREITLPDGLTTIGVWAFVGCIDLTNIVIPDSVTSIGEDAFGNTGLSNREQDDIYEQVEQNRNKPDEEERALLEEIIEDSNVSSEPVAQESSEIAPSQSGIEDDKQVIGSASPNKDKSGGSPLFVIVLLLVLLAGGVAVFLIQSKKKAPSGTVVKIQCPTCGELCDENAAFCTKCGVKVNEK